MNPRIELLNLRDRLEDTQGSAASERAMRSIANRVARAAFNELHQLDDSFDHVVTGLLDAESPANSVAAGLFAAKAAPLLSFLTWARARNRQLVRASIPKLHKLRPGEYLKVWALGACAALMESNAYIAAQTRGSGLYRDEARHQEPAVDRPDSGNLFS